MLAVQAGGKLPLVGAEQQCDSPQPCWCSADNLARDWFLAIRLLASAAGALPAAMLSRMAGRKATVLVGTCLFLAGECLSAAVLKMTHGTCCNRQQSRRQAPASIRLGACRGAFPTNTWVCIACCVSTCAQVPYMQEPALTWGCRNGLNTSHRRHD